MKGYKEGYFKPGYREDTWKYIPKRYQSITYGQKDIYEFTNQMHENRSRPIDVPWDMWEEYLETLSPSTSFFSSKAYDDEGWPT